MKKLSLKFWLRTLAALIFLLIVVGGTVRNLNAGLSCPDWPLCQGRLIPVFDIHVFAEYFHRLFAAMVSIITISVAFVIFRDRTLRNKLGRFMGVGLALLASQVILGGLTVLEFLKSDIVTLHLATGTLFFATILIMALKSGDLVDSKQNAEVPAASIAIPEKNSKTARLALIGSIAGLVLYCQIILGGVVSSHYAGLACPDFPTCLGKWWPGFSGALGFQFIHRLGALTVFFVVSFFVFKMVREKRTLWGAAGVGLLLLTQICLGVGNVIFQLPVAMSVAHLAVAEALLALILMSTYEIRHFQLH